MAETEQRQDATKKVSIRPYIMRKVWYHCVDPRADLKIFSEKRSIQARILNRVHTRTFIKIRLLLALLPKMIIK